MAPYIKQTFTEQPTYTLQNTYISQEPVEFRTDNILKHKTHVLTNTGKFK